MIDTVERVFRVILIAEVLLICILIFLLLTGYTNHPGTPAKINVTTPPTITVTVTTSPEHTPTPTPTAWYYDPEKGYYVNGSYK
jgi:hypothetical protein